MVSRFAEYLSLLKILIIVWVWVQLAAEVQQLLSFTYCRAWVDLRAWEET
jgi:hypothetical protein